MNCAGVEKLLPLYVEGDLSQKEARLVEVHLSSCKDCRSLAEEFRLSQERLQNFSAPEFGAEFYEQIREAVLARITAQPQQPSLVGMIRGRFSLRPALVFSMACLVLFGALSFGLYRSLVKEKAPLLALDKSLLILNPDLLIETSTQGGQNGEGFTGEDNSQSGFIHNIVRVKSGLNNRSIMRRGSSSTQSTAPGEEAVAKRARTNDTSEAATAPQAVARMEFQTSDPNIRIIWLGRKSSE